MGTRVNRMKRTLAAVFVLMALAVSPYAVFGKDIDYSGSVPVIQKANALVKAGKTNEAIDVYFRALEQDPQNAYLYHSMRALLYRHLKEYEHAEKDYNRAIELRPKNALDYQSRANLYKMWGKYQSAINDINKAIELFPGNKSYLYNNRADIYKRFGKYEHAIEDYKTAARLGDEEAQEVLTKEGIQW
jgi:tetratricopeptide (TPR) repeat protein